MQCNLSNHETTTITTLNVKCFDLVLTTRREKLIREKRPYRISINTLDFCKPNVIVSKSTTTTLGEY